MLTIRPASKLDATACAQIHRWYVENTAITLEYDAPTVAQMALRIATYTATHAWLVAHDEAGVCGYAFGGPLKERVAYRWSVETAVYVAQDRDVQGIGRALYEELLPRLAARGYLRAVAGITLPNPAHEALHSSAGFERVGMHPRIAWKNDAWHDVLFVQRDLGEGSTPPEPPS